MKKWLPFFRMPWRYAIVLLAIALFFLHGFQILRLPFLDRLDNTVYDARLLAHAPRTLDPHVVVVDIDEVSLQAFGRWPWSRDTVASLVSRLVNEQQASAVGFDMVFAEAESPSADLSLARALQQQPVVLGYYFTSDRAGHTTGALPQPVFDPAILKGRDFQITSWTGHGGNLATFVAAAPQAGFFNAISDVDGQIRSAPLLAEYQGQFYESMALALLRRHLSKMAVNQALPSVHPVFADDGRQSQTYPHLSHLMVTADTGVAYPIAVDDRVAVLIPYRGAGGPMGGSFTYISAKDILQGALPARTLKDKIVLVGSSAPALEDLRVTPMGSTYPGVEVQANLASALVSNNIYIKPDFAMGFEAAQILLISLAMLFWLPRLSAAGAMLLTACTLGGLWWLHDYLFVAQHWVLPISSALVLGICSYVSYSSYGFFVEGHRRRHLTRLFGSYVSPKWVRHMVRSQNDYSMQASNQVLTVMFCDMRGFTRLAAHLPPLELQALLNQIFNRLSKIIQEHGGTIDKYMGDCVMAFWGAPETQTDHALRALRCALALQRELVLFNQERAHLPQVQNLHQDIQMGMGINTGLMCVGDMGSNIRRSYTVIGDAVNIASRLEGLCKIRRMTILTSAATKNAAEQQGVLAAVRWTDLGSATIEGITEPVHLFTLHET